MGEDYKSGGVAFYLEQFKKAQHVLLVDFDNVPCEAQGRAAKVFKFPPIVDSD